jgi:hypothetical protein
MPPLELTVQKSDLQKNKVFIATPMYGGQNHGLYMKSCLDLQTIFHQLQIENRFSFLFNESLITRARNYLTDEFLRTDYTHLLFLDSDIEFDPQDIITLIALDKEIIGAAYPKKSINWGNIKKAITKNPNIEADELEQLVGEYVFNPVPGTERFSVYEPVEVLEIGTGYMLIKREVFAKFKEAYPQFEYKPDHLGSANFDGSRKIHAYFDTVIDPVSQRYLSEDYMFCQWCRNIGVKVWLCPWMRTKHNGTYAFSGNLPSIANNVGNL